MADNHWNITGTGNWSDTTKWSLGHAPSSSEKAVFDMLNPVVTMDANPGNCAGMDWSGATGSPQLLGGGSAYLYVYGNSNVIFKSGMVVDLTNDSYGLRFNDAGKTVTISPNGCTLTRCRLALTAAETVIIDGNWVPANLSSVLHNAGTLVLNTGITAQFSTYAAANGDLTLTLNNATLSILANFTMYAANTLTANTATIKLTGTANFVGGGLTYYEVQFNGTAHTISNNNHSTNLKFLPVGVQTDTFTDGLTWTTTNCSRSATTSVITLKGSGTGGWNIAQA